MEPGIIYVAVAAFAGGILTALLGWLESGKPFVPRKFGASLVRALIAGGAFAVAYQFGNGVSIVDIFVAVLGGAGIDVVSNRVAGAIRAQR